MVDVEITISPSVASTILETCLILLRAKLSGWQELKRFRHAGGIAEGRGDKMHIKRGSRVAETWENRV